MSLMRNPALLGAVALTLALQMAVIYVPWLQPIFRTRPPSGQELAVCLLVPLIVLVAVEIEKALARRVARRAASAGPAPRSASMPVSRRWARTVLPKLASYGRRLGRAIRLHRPPTPTLVVLPARPGAKVERTLVRASAPVGLRLP
jgi:hypothetical protein